MSARKKTGKKEMPATAETKTRPVRVDLSADIHRLLRLVAADMDISMAACARDQLAIWLKEEAKKRGIK